MGKRGKVFGKREKEEGTSVKPFPCGPGRTRDNSTGTKNLVFMNMDRRSGGKGNRLPLFFSLLAFAVYFLYSLQSPSSSDEPNRSKHAFGIATSDVRGSMHSGKFKHWHCRPMCQWQRLIFPFPFGSSQMFLRLIRLSRSARRDFGNSGRRTTL